MHSKKRELEAKRTEIINKYTVYGITRATLANQYGVHQSTLDAALDRWQYKGLMKLPNTTQWDLEEDKDSILHMYEDGYSVSELCRRYQCSFGTMVRALKRWDVYRGRSAA